MTPRGTAPSRGDGGGRMLAKVTQRAMALAWSVAVILAACRGVTAEPGIVTVAVGPRAGVVAVGAGAAWVPITGDGTLTRIDARTERVSGTVHIGDPEAFTRAGCGLGEGFEQSVHSWPIGSFGVRSCDVPSAVTATASAVWVLKNDARALLRIDPASLEVLTSIPLDAYPWDLAADNESVWITSYADDMLIHVDARAGRVRARIAGLPHGPTGVAIDGDAVWVTSSRAGMLTKVDAVEDRVIGSVPAGIRPLPLVVAAGAVWVRDEGSGRLLRFRRDTLLNDGSYEGGPFVGRDGQDAIAFDGTGIWLASLDLRRINVSTGAIDRRIDHAGIAVTSTDGVLWVTDLTGTVSRVAPTELRD